MLSMTSFTFSWLSLANDLDDLAGEPDEAAADFRAVLSGKLLGKTITLPCCELLLIDGAS